MEYLIWGGAGVTLVGLVGLIYSAVLVMRARRASPAIAFRWVVSASEPRSWSPPRIAKAAHEAPRSETRKIAS